MDALESFPDTLSKITATLSIFYESEDMHRRTSALYVSIFDALEGILTRFKERTASKSLKAAWKQTNYKKDLLERIEAIETRVSDFNDTASRCAMSTLKDTDQRLALGRQEASDGFKDLRLGNSAISTQVEDLRQELRQEIQQIAREQEAVGAQQANFLNKVQASFEDQMKDARVSVVKSRRPRKASIDPGTIQEQLMYEPRLYERGLTSCQRIIRDPPLAEEHRAATIFQHQRLMAWLTNPVPDLVVVNGNAENNAAMSYVCAQLILSLASTDDSIIPVYFFCGEHINWRKDPNAHPVSLMHGLIGQLLSQWPPSKISSVKGLSDKIQSDEPLVLCSVFSSLISPLPDTAIVVCFIDAISYFEDNERRKNACAIARSLNKVVKLDEGPLLKVLWTSPSIC